MGRPKIEKPKSKQFRLRMTSEDFCLLDAVASECHTTKTEVLMSGFYELLRHFSDEELAVFNECMQRKMTL